MNVLVVREKSNQDKPQGPREDKERTSLDQTKWVRIPLKKEEFESLALRPMEMFMSNKVKEPKPSHKAKLVALYSVEEVMFWLHTITSRRFVTPSGGSVQATRTLKLFKKKGVDCVLCGMNGKFFKELCIGEDHFYVYMD